MSECIEKRIPWFTWGAIERAIQLAMDDDLTSVLEWGAGGSTLFWLDRSMDVVTIEHAAPWLDRVGKHRLEMATWGQWWPHWRPSTRDPGVGLPVVSQRAPGHFNGYVAEGHAQAGIHGRFDIVVVDGRARNECMRVATQIAATWIILDNSDRADYAPGIELVKDWHAEHFAGPGPESGGSTWRTSFFRRP